MSELPPRGWFPDPEDPSSWRYWDGRDWTDQRAPREQPKRVDGGVCALGWVMVVLVPLVGLLMGLWLLWGREEEQGGWMALAAIAWSTVLAVFVL